jgi:hypothetical protein
MVEGKPKRRWFRFSLRTLFLLVTIIGVGYGIFLFQRDARLVIQRRQFIAELKAFKKTRNVFDVKAELSPLKNPDRTLSPVRRFLNDHCYSIIRLPRSYQQTLVTQAVSLFPEAQIEHWQQVTPTTNGAFWISPVVIQEMK